MCGRILKEERSVVIKMKALCNHFHRSLSGKNTNWTSHLRAHRERCRDRNQSNEEFEFEFDEKFARKELATMIILHDYS